MIHPTDTVTNSSEGITLDCKGIGGGSITYHWEASDIDKDQWMKISDSNAQKLALRTLKKSKNFRCIASNEAGSTASNPSTATLMEILTHPTNPLTVTALEDSTLTCLSSVDDATYSWHRVGTSVPSRSIGQNNNTLTIPKATPYDIGQYYCMAEKQKITVKSDEALLRVNGKKLCKLQTVIYVAFTDQLSISISSNNLLIGKGNTAQFTATTSGVSSERSNFIYEWKKRNSDSLPDKVLGVNGTVLTIPNAVKSDEGQYYCIVTNEWGRSVESSYATLTVYTGI